MPGSTGTDELNITEAEQTTEKVETAADEVRQAAAGAPNAEIEDSLKAIALTLEEVKVELKKLDVKQAEQTTEAATAPDVTVLETPEKQYRYVRRNGRRIKREVKV